MRRPAQIRVQCFAEVLCPHLNRVFDLGSGSADSPRKPEDVLSQGLKFASRFRAVSGLLFVFLVLALCMPLASAQEPTPAPEATATTETTGKEPTPTPAPSYGTADELRVLQQQGKADTAILERVLATSGPAKGDTRAGDVRVAFTITPAEGWWDKAGGNKLTWHDAPANNVHLRIFVLSLSDGRLLPGLSLCATLTDANGNEQSAPADFGWYPLMNAYGGNFPLAADSSYTLRVTVEGPPAHPGPSAEHIQHVIAEFPPVDITQDAVSRLPLATATAWANEAELLKPSNAALSTAITALWQRTASGIEKPSGDYFVGYALDDSDSALQVGSKLHLKNPFDFSGKDNVVIDVLARDSRTGRFIPGLKPQVDLVAPDVKTLEPGETFLVWHPWLNHYGRSTRIPRKGVYKLRVHFDAPGFRRWGRQSERFAAPADVEFENISLNPEKKD